jgi:hypothetical protein
VGRDGPWPEKPSPRLRERWQALGWWYADDVLIDSSERSKLMNVHMCTNMHAAPDIVHTRARTSKQTRTRTHILDGLMDGLGASEPTHMHTCFPSPQTKHNGLPLLLDAAPGPLTASASA